jgi:exo-1,4-beta-D-glucosaminidase
MKRARFLLLLCLPLIIGASAVAVFAADSFADDSTLVLKEGWRIQSSARVAAAGETVSTLQYVPKGWYQTSVPTTVLNALIENKVYPDPFYGVNLRSIPGTAYPIGDNFSNDPMPPDSPFRVAWWYRKEFSLPPAYRGKVAWLHLDGVNFRANVWLNGNQIGDARNVAGSYRFFELEVSRVVKLDAPNVLAVEVFPPQPEDLAITWVDVNPMPADKDMGLWQDVYLSSSGPVSVRHAQVTSHLDLPSLSSAQIKVTAELRNAQADAVVRGVLKGAIAKARFAQEVTLAPGETRLVTFEPAEFPQLSFANPRIWWPWQMGSQPMYELNMEFQVDGQVSDHQTVRFGIRDVSSELTPEGYRLFRVNGQKLLVRGAGWWSDMFLRSSSKRQEAEIRYARDMRLNVLRMDGKFEDDNFLDLADRYGLLLMPGWCCCDHWEKWETWKPEDYSISVESLRDRIRWFRNHPSILAWLNGDDNPPPENVAQLYINVLKEENWPNRYFGSATGKPAAVTGATGFKMTGPYEWVPPAYWLTDTEHGGAFGFITETSPGPAIPTEASLSRFVPPDHLWPIDEDWDYHAGGGVFKNIKVYTQALNARYGEAKSLADFALKAQAMDYDGQRAMYEAYGRNKYTSTGVLQEMLNGAWPSLVWVLYDYYLRPAGGYFGTKKALEPVHIQYSYDDRSIVVVNSLYHDVKNLQAKADVYDFDLKQRFSKEAELDVPSDGVGKVFVIPEISGLTTTYFVHLALDDADGRTLSTNFYWLSTKPDVLDWAKTSWYDTPTKSFADLTELQNLPPVDVKLAATSPEEGGTTRVTVENPTQTLAFMVHLQINKGDEGEEVLPVLWDDNYFSLLPGERRAITATYEAKDLGAVAPVVRVDGWNIRAKSL